MAFGKETKEEKQERKAHELLEKYGLQELTDERDIESVKQIATNLAGNKFAVAGAALGMDGYKTAHLTYLQAIVEQNFLIIRQLNRLNQK